MSEAEKQVSISNEIHTYGSDMNPFDVKMKQVGKVSSLLYLTFGGIGLAVTGLAALLRLFFFLSGDISLVELIMYLILPAVFYWIVRHGVEQRYRLQRAERYFELCDYKAYGEIETLARGIAKSRSFVIKDLQKMIAVGIYPEGHLDEENTRIMLNDTVYQQYLEKKSK